MAGTPNPIDAVIVDGVDVSKAAFRSYEKTYVRKTIANADAIANGDWVGQFGGLHLLSNNADYDIDTSDTTTAPDGDNFVRDQNGILFVKQPVQSSVTTLVATTAGALAIPDDVTRVEVRLDTPGTLTLTIGLAVNRKPFPLSVVDVNAIFGTYPVTVNRSGSDTFKGVDGGATNVVLDSPGMTTTFYPTADKNGIYDGFYRG